MIKPILYVTSLGCKNPPVISYYLFFSPAVLACHFVRLIYTQAANTRTVGSIGLNSRVVRLHLWCCKCLPKCKCIITDWMTCYITNTDLIHSSVNTTKASVCCKVCLGLRQMPPLERADQMKTANPLWCVCVVSSSLCYSDHQGQASAKRQGKFKKVLRNNDLSQLRHRVGNIWLYDGVCCMCIHHFQACWCTWEIYTGVVVSKV